jgi:hypothetical protein
MVHGIFTNRCFFRLANMRNATGFFSSCSKELDFFKHHEESQNHLCAYFHAKRPRTGVVKVSDAVEKVDPEKLEDILNSIPELHIRLGWIQKSEGRDLGAVFVKLMHHVDQEVFVAERSSFLNRALISSGEYPSTLNTGLPISYIFKGSYRLFV